MCIYVCVYMCVSVERWVGVCGTHRAPAMCYIGMLAYIMHLTLTTIRSEDVALLSFESIKLIFREVKQICG